MRHMDRQELGRGRGSLTDHKVPASLHPKRSTQQKITEKREGGGGVTGDYGGKVCTIKSYQRVNEVNGGGNRVRAFFRLFPLIHSLLVAHSQRVRRGWALTFSLNVCSPFLLGWFSRTHCGSWFHTSTTASGKDRRISFRDLSGRVEVTLNWL